MVRAAEEVLQSNHVDHVFVGAMSVIVFGEPRTTRDVDVLARIPDNKVPRLVRDFQKRGFFASEYDLGAALRERAHCTLEDRSGPLRLDLAPLQGYAAERALRTSIRVRWRGIEIPLAGPEDTVVMKLKYGSSQDIEDAFGVLSEQFDRLDFDGMRAFARRERVLTLLEELIRRVDRAN